MVLGVQPHRPDDRLRVSIREQLEGRIGQHFVTLQVPLCPPLDVMTVDVRRAVLEMEQEPQFKAGVGDRQTDGMPTRQGDRIRQPRVLVHVEDAPDLIMGTASSAPGVPFRPALCFDGVLHELERCAAKGVDRYQHPIPMSSSPVREIAIFGRETLHEDEKLQTLSRRCRPPRRRRAFPQRGPTDATSRAVSANCCSERMGVAPYRPAR